MPSNTYNHVRTHDSVLVYRMGYNRTTCLFLGDSGSNRTQKSEVFLKSDFLSMFPFASLFLTIFYAQIDPKCTSLLSGFLDGVVRYLSIAKDDASTSRTKGNKLNVEFQLLQVFKPHTKSVTSMVLDKHGKILATGVSLSLVSTLYFWYALCRYW